MNPVANKLIVVYVSAIEKLNFFLRFRRSAALQGFDFKIITHSPSIKFIYPKATYISCSTRLEPSHTVEQIVESSIEGMSSGKIDRFRAEGVHRRLNDLFRSYVNDYEFIVCFLWNGSTLMEAITAKVANRYDVGVRFFEIGNFPGKVFVDPLGVNYKASISDLAYFKTHYLSDAQPGKYEGWLRNYLKTAHSSHTVKQARNVKRINVFFILDWLWYIIFKPVVTPPTLINKLRDKYGRRNYMSIDESDTNGSYIFYPCQVASDSQLILNSDICNIGALKIIAARAKGRECSVVVKLHPAEPDVNMELEIRQFCRINGFLISDRSVPELLEGASEVITINSTVGLQAILFDKPLTILGDAFYKKYSLEELLFYINEYLLCVDYFSFEDICEDILIKVVERRFLGERY